MKYGKVWRRGRYSYRWVYVGKQRRRQRKTSKGNWKFYGAVYSTAAGIGWLVVKGVKIYVALRGSPIN